MLKEVFRLSRLWSSRVKEGKGKEVSFDFRFVLNDDLPPCSLDLSIEGNQSISLEPPTVNPL